MNQKRLEDSIKEEIRISKDFKSIKIQEIEKLQLDIKYYEGQIDALNLTLSTLDKYKDEK